MRHKFLAPSVEQILSLAKTMPIIRTRSGKWVEPRRGIIVPQELLFDNQPLFTESELNHGIPHCEYVDSVYNNERDRLILSRLGCPVLSIDHVSSIISSGKYPFS